MWDCCGVSKMNPRRQGKLKEAIADCSVAIQVDEGYVKAYQRRGRCYQVPFDAPCVALLEQAVWLVPCIRAGALLGWRRPCSY